MAKKSGSKPPEKVIYRSAVTGEFVTPATAKKNPRETEKEHRPTKPKK